MYWMRADGGGQAVRLTEAKNAQFAFSFSPDGKRLAFAEFDPHTNVDLWTLPLEDAASDHPKAGKPEPFLVTSFNEMAPMISPDGHWLGFFTGGKLKKISVGGGAAIPLGVAYAAVARPRPRRMG